MSTNTDDTEEVLDAHWLTLRQPFDDQARDIDVLARLCQYADQTPLRKVVDLGAGTGNHARFLLDRLPQLASTAELLLIEQHPHLLSLATPPVGTPAALADSHRWRYQVVNLHHWLHTDAKAFSPDLITHNALLDLFTESELTGLMRFLSTDQVAMYSTLNYESVRFSPAHPDDSTVIALFEDHMCRPLDRGQPLGPAVDNTLTLLNRQYSTHELIRGRSAWQIGPDQVEFMLRNLNFYRDGAAVCARSTKECNLIEDWFRHRRNAARTGKLAITVNHYDYLLLPR